eukprot:COSAG04_NODE_28145_length_277_cov_1.140449_1_plen_43_part_01
MDALGRPHVVGPGVGGWGRQRHDKPELSSSEPAIAAADGLSGP